MVSNNGKTGAKFFHPAYLAGIADSDGSFITSKLNQKRPVCSFRAMFSLTWTANNYTKEFLEKLVKQYGGSYCYVKSSSMTGYNYKNSKPYFKYCLSGDNLEIFVKEVYPYLVLKKRQALNMLRIRRHTKLGMYGNHNPKPQKLTDFQIKVHEYNKRLNGMNKPEKV
jgi:hypothetical protein